MADENANFPGPFRVSLGVAIAVFALTFIVWIFFFMLDMQLRTESTAFVALLMLAVVSAGKWLLARARDHGAHK
ncbi:MAG: hypothetical protein M3Y57_15920 [Acidobacteriota bacterium]|nr:hypothetical protein [Acidobacteriota bacterium]